MSIAKTIQTLAKQLNLTGLDQETPYVLSPEEEGRIVANEKVRIANEYRYHLTKQGKSLAEIEFKLSQIDFDTDPNLNIEELLRTANANAYQKLWEAEQRRKEKEQAAILRKQIQETWTANYFFRYLKMICREQTGQELLFNEATRPLIQTICFFLSEDPRFETELKYEAKKGLLLRGVSGLGKTFLLKCLQHNPRNPIQIVSMLDIADAVRADGDYELLPYGSKLYLDDVGSEEATVNHYGTRINWFKNFLELYYLKSTAYNRLIISTNNNFSELEEKYGFRVRDRIREMFNVIDVQGKSMRK